MSKVILVMDMPMYCIDCPCHFVDDPSIWCGVVNRDLETNDIEIYKPEWCPLREMPEKAYHPDYCDNGRYDRGWNDCIKEILKGEEHEQE